MRRSSTEFFENRVNSFLKDGGLMDRVMLQKILFKGPPLRGHILPHEARQNPSHFVAQKIRFATTVLIEEKLPQSSSFFRSKWQSPEG
jgi:hypothetical protein